MITIKRGTKETKIGKTKKESNNFKYKLICNECDKTKRTSKYKEMRKFQLRHFIDCGKHPLTEFL